MPRKDPDARRAYQRAWYARNADKVKAQVAVRKHTLYAGQCRHCGGPTVGGSKGTAPEFCGKPACASAQRSYWPKAQSEDGGEIAALALELAAAKHCHCKDNKHLIRERDEARQQVAEARAERDQQVAALREALHYDPRGEIADAERFHKFCHDNERAASEKYDRDRLARLVIELVAMVWTARRALAALPSASDKRFTWVCSDTAHHPDGRERLCVVGEACPACLAPEPSAPDGAE